VHKRIKFKWLAQERHLAAEAMAFDGIAGVTGDQKDWQIGHNFSHSIG
jgi:hypothetical protein